MRNLFISFVCLFVLASPAYAQITFLGAESADYVDGGTDTSATSTPDVNTSGATLIVAATCGNNTSGTFTDNQGNTYTGLSPSPNINHNGISKIWYKTSPNTHASAHNFTIGSGTNGYMAGFIAWFSGTGAYDTQEADTDVGSGTTIQAGSVTPSQALSLFFAFVCHGDAGVDATTASIGSSFNLISGQIADGSGNYGIAAGYKIQSGSAAAENPTWTLSATQPGSSANIAIFQPAAAAAGGSGKMTMGVFR